jgi:flotillin
MIKQAGYQAEIDTASAQAQQAGPLADASARQHVVVEETKVAELEAQREEQRLQATIRKPADAKAYESVTLAKAARDARISGAEAERQEVELHAQASAERVRLEAVAEAERVRVDAIARSESTRLIGEAEAAATAAKGRAEGEAVQARGMAEAEAIKARADALAENQDAVIGQQLAEQWPAIVEAAAKPFASVDQMIVLNGAQGLSEALAAALSQGVAGLQLARNLLAGGGNGASAEPGDRGALQPPDAAPKGGKS